MLRPLLLLLLGAVAVSAVIFHVEPQDSYCFGEELGYDMVVHGEFSAGVGHTRSSVRVTVHAPPKDEDDEDSETPLIYEKQEATEGSFAFTSELQGEHRFCFHNEGRSSSVEVSFSLKVGFEAKDYSQVAQREHLSPVEVELTKLHDIASQLRDDMVHIRRREARHRDTTESTNSAVVGWSVLSMAIIVVLGLYQTWYLRRFFRKKKLIN